MTAVITGLGVVSAFGTGAPSFFGALAEGKCGIGPIRSFDASTFPTRIAGEVPERDAAALRAHRDRKFGFGLAAAREAWTHAKLDSAAQDLDGRDARSPRDGRAALDARDPRFDRSAALVVALGLEQAFLEDFGPIFDSRPAGAVAGERAKRDTGAERTIHWEREPQSADPRVRFRSRVDLTADAIADALGLTGPRIVNSSACAAGALAVTQAAAMIERGQADIVVCGGADSMVNPLGLGGMCRLGAPSPRNDLDACRPFDRARDGLVIGEGAAMFVVESAARADARGARVLARIVGWGSTQDAYRATAPRPDGSAAAAAMSRALRRAKLAPEAIGYINAHGTGTPLNDPAECKAIHAALGAHAERVPVSSIKGAIGHLMAASGAIELAACLLAFERDLLPGTANHRDRDPDCNVDVIGEQPRRARVDHVLSNSFGFGGQNASVILGRPE